MASVSTDFTALYKCCYYIIKSYTTPLRFNKRHFIACQRLSHDYTGFIDMGYLFLFRLSHNRHCVMRSINVLLIHLLTYLLNFQPRKPSSNSSSSKDVSCLIIGGLYVNWRCRYSSGKHIRYGELYLVRLWSHWLQSQKNGRVTTYLERI